jgi:hypothetical protein
VWAFGVLAYSLAIGMEPFHGAEEDVTELKRRILHEEPHFQASKAPPEMVEMLEATPKKGVRPTMKQVMRLSYFT